MLFRVERVETDLEYLNGVLLFFLTGAVSQNRYVKSRLFPAEFIPVTQGAKSHVNKNFKKLFQEIKQLDNFQKELLLRIFHNHSSVEELCGDINFLPKSIVELPERLVTVLKDIGNYLYSSVLKNSKFVGLECVNDSIAEHYSRFIAQNGEVCCFCGMRTYTDQLFDTEATKQWVPAYDHYLPKKIYPLTTVNFKNLVPICGNCNSKAKTQFDPCFCPESNRRLSYYPYLGNDLPKLEFKLRSNSENVMNQDMWEVQLFLNGIDEDEQQKRHTWDSLFKVTNRLNHRLNINYKDWVQQALGGESLSGDDLIERFNAQAKIYGDQAKRTADSLHKSTLFGFMADLGVEALETLVESANNDRLAPSTIEQGREELLALGINI